MPDWKTYVVKNLRGRGLTGERQEEFAEELSQQMEDAYAAARRQGLSEEEAVESAKAEVEDWDRLVRDIRTAANPLTKPLPESWIVRRREMGLVPISGIRMAWRSLSRRPGFLLVTVVALTLGVGIPTTMYSIVNGVLRDLPFEDGDRIFYIGLSNPVRGYNLRQAPADVFRYWRQHQTSFEELAAYGDSTASLSGDGHHAEQVRIGYLDPQVLGVLRVEPPLGRGFVAEDAAAGAEPVVLLGHSVWENRYASDPSVLGRQVRVDAQPHTIVGVMPEGFRFPAKEVLWTPLSLEAREQGTDPLSVDVRANVLGRLEDGATLSQARAEFETFSMQLEDVGPEERKADRAVIVPYTQERMGDVAPILYTMLAAVSFLLIAACANVANLLLARSLSRTREIAIRSALGASRWRIASMVFGESFLIAALGGVLGLAIATLGVMFFNHGIAGMSGDMAFWIDIRVDAPTLLFAAAMVFLGSLAAGAVPAWRTSRTDIQQVLQQESLTGTLKMGRFSRVILGGQIALSCALLAISCLMIKGVIQLKTFDFGIPAQRTLTAAIELPRTSYPEHAQRYDFYSRLGEEMRARPGVEEVAFTSTLPGRGSAGWPVEIEGQAVERQEDLPLTARVTVSENFFSLLQARVLSGRDFTASDDLNALRVAIVNEGFARRFFPGQNPLGKQITLGRSSWKESPRTIVGVVPNLLIVNLEFNLPDADGVYVPMRQSANSMDILVRASAPMAMAGVLRDAVERLDADLPVAQVDRLDRAVLEDKALLEVFGGLFLFFGLAALFLSTLGLYGIVAFTVQQRVREMGIRRALGASSVHILSQSLRRGTLQVGAGIVLGLTIAALMSPMLAEGFFRTDPHDPSVFLLTAAVLAGTGLLACLVPARRALRTSPLDALRYE
ncbi:MAG TPA: ABC transporter permease [Acidobacteriota bacterium]|nr:ABC transporter permease [Acidobacteriota bacterium]